MIFDTNALSAWLEGDGLIRTMLPPSAVPYLPVIVVGEYLYGLLQSSHATELRTRLFQMASESVVLGVDLRTAASYAELREELRQRGRPIPSNDLWIAALAVQHRLPVLSRDIHFDGLPGVSRITW